MIPGFRLARMLTASARELGGWLIRPHWPTLIDLAKRHGGRLSGPRIIVTGTGMIDPYGDLDDDGPAVCDTCGESFLACDCLAED